MSNTTLADINTPEYCNMHFNGCQPEMVDVTNLFYWGNQLSDEVGAGVGGPITGVGIKFNYFDGASVPGGFSGKGWKSTSAVFAPSAGNSFTFGWNGTLTLEIEPTGKYYFDPELTDNEIGQLVTTSIGSKGNVTVNRDGDNNVTSIQFVITLPNVPAAPPVKGSGFRGAIKNASAGTFNGGDVESNDAMFDAPGVINVAPNAGNGRTPVWMNSDGSMGGSGIVRSFWVAYDKTPLGVFHISMPETNLLGSTWIAITVTINGISYNGAMHASGNSMNADQGMIFQWN